MSEKTHYQPEKETTVDSVVGFVQRGRQKFGDFKFIHTGAIYWGVDDPKNLKLFSPAGSAEPVAFAWYDDPLAADYGVMEDDSALHETVIDWLETQARTNPENEHVQDPFSITCFEDDTFKAQVLEQRGFTKDADDYFCHYLRSLSSIPDPVVTEGFSVRAVNGISEVEQRVALHREVFSTPTVPSRMTVEKYARYMALPGYNNDLLIDMVSVAPNGDFASFTIVWIDAVNKVAYVEPVGTKAEYRRKGLAKATIYSALHYAKDHGCERAIVLSHSEEAHRTYEQIGFSLARKEYFFKKQLQ